MKIVIIGAQAAGASAAAKAKRLASDATICIYEKSAVASFGACGLPYFLGHHFTNPNEMIARTSDDFLQSGIAIHLLHEVMAIDLHNKKVIVQDLQTQTTFEDRFDKLMLAVGSIPLIPRIRNVQLANVFTLKTLADGLAINDLLSADDIHRVTIVGAGYIGLEVAEALHRIGKSVRIIQLAERVLEDSFDRDITPLITEALEKYCTLHLHEQVIALHGETRVTAIETNKGRYLTDAVIIATGVRPANQLYSGLPLKTLPEGAIVTDCYGATSFPDLYAAGDCAAINHYVSGHPVYIPLATGANKLGRLVGENMLGGNKKFPGTLATAGLQVFDIEAGRSGLSENEVNRLNIPYATVMVKDKNHSNYLTGQQDIYLKLIYRLQDRVLLGGQIVGGKNTAIRIDILATAIWAKMTVDDLSMLDLLYAPPFARPWHVFNIAGMIAK